MRAGRPSRWVGKNWGARARGAPAGGAAHPRRPNLVHGGQSPVVWEKFLPVNWGDSTSSRARIGCRVGTPPTAPHCGKGRRFVPLATREHDSASVAIWARDPFDAFLRGQCSTIRNGPGTLSPTGGRAGPSPFPVRRPLSGWASLAPCIDTSHLVWDFRNPPGGAPPIKNASFGHKLTGPGGCNQGGRLGVCLAGRRSPGTRSWCSKWDYLGGEMPETVLAQFYRPRPGRCPGHKLPAPRLRRGLRPGLMSACRPDKSPLAGASRNRHLGPFRKKKLVSKGGPAFPRRFAFRIKKGGVPYTAVTTVGPRRFPHPGAG